VAIAERFAAKHRERASVLERRVAVQADELALAERETAEMTAQLREAQQGRVPTSAPGASSPAAPSPRTAADLESEILSARADRALHEAAVDAQLAHLKKKLGKQP
ncbi:MAG: hypothetical protein H0U85_02585, partial [Gemmatimonadales bacterium]|nr:hypothetical protein [Gemmatimonadales bacterium]